MDSSQVTILHSVVLRDGSLANLNCPVRYSSHFSQQNMPYMGDGGPFVHQGSAECSTECSSQSSCDFWPAGGEWKNKGSQFSCGGILFSTGILLNIACCQTTVLLSVRQLLFPVPAGGGNG